LVRARGGHVLHELLASDVCLLDERRRPRVHQFAQCLQGRAGLGLTLERQRQRGFVASRNAIRSHRPLREEREDRLEGHGLRVEHRFRAAHVARRDVAEVLGQRHSDGGAVRLARSAPGERRGNLGAGQERVDGDLGKRDPVGEGLVEVGPGARVLDLGVCRSAGLRDTVIQSVHVVITTETTHARRDPHWTSGAVVALPIPFGACRAGWGVARGRLERLARTQAWGAGTQMVTTFLQQVAWQPHIRPCARRSKMRP